MSAVNSEKPHLPEPRQGTITRVETAYFSGPLPPPSLLAQYNDIIPDGAERILAMAERQSLHREALERDAVHGDLEAQKRGSIFAFILAIVVVLAGVYLMAIGKSGLGFAAIIAQLVSLVGVFALSRSVQKKERDEKASTLDSRRSE